MNEPSIIRPRQNRSVLLRTLAVLLVIVGLIVVAVASRVGYLAYMAINVRKPNAYAMEYASLLLVEHLRMNDGAWPRNWIELSNTCASSNIELLSSSPAFVMMEIIERVEIDWAGNPTLLQRLAEENKSMEGALVRLKSGRRDWFVGSEPNERIYLYLQGITEPADRPNDGPATSVDNSDSSGWGRHR